MAFLHNDKTKNKQVLRDVVLDGLECAKFMETTISSLKYLGESKILMSSRLQLYEFDPDSDTQTLVNQ